MTHANSDWWGRRTIDVGDQMRWRIGPTTLWVQHLPGEWRIARSAVDDPLDSSLEIAVPVEADEVTSAGEVERFARTDRGSVIVLRPMPADRAIVSRPNVPFHIAAGDEVVVYVSSPLWIRVELAEPSRGLLEIPSHRPSDTWLGPSTLTGELCYATRTACRLALADLPVRPHRAITSVHLSNMATDSLLVERLSVPVPKLALYRDDTGRIWTQSIRLLRDDVDEGLAELVVEDDPPAVASTIERIAEPREAAARGGLVRAFGALFD